jgi:SAM-dependent methyltransferase
MAGRTVLHVGCGFKRLEDLPPAFRDGSWTEIRLDIDVDVAPDMVGTITDMAAVETGSVDAVFSSHNIEHVYWHEVPAVIAEFWRVLKPTGFALITCPDLQSLGQKLAGGNILETLYESALGPVTPLDVLYGHSASIAAGQHYMAHKCGFTGKTLTELLDGAHFSRVVVVRHGGDLWALASRKSMSLPEFKALFTKYIPVQIAG